MLVCIEGIDGVGKTTITNILAKSLSARICREPGTTFLGEWARFLLEKGDIESATSRMLLYLLSRSELIDEIKLKLATENKDIWLLDRFSPSTIAYQGVFVDTPERIYELEKIVRQNIVPDLTIYLYNDIEVCVERTLIRDGIPYLPDFAKKQRISHFNVIADSYEKAFSLLKWPMVRIKTDTNPSDIAFKIKRMIEDECKTRS